jgi:hypothetical protein
MAMYYNALWWNPYFYDMLLNMGEGPKHLGNFILNKEAYISSTMVLRWCKSIC